jgi:hypothetical protein
MAPLGLPSFVGHGCAALCAAQLIQARQKARVDGPEKKSFQQTERLRPEKFFA